MLGHCCKGELKCRYYSDCDLDFDASGCGGHSARLASQQKLGLWPERRAGIDCRGPARPDAHGTPLIVIGRESEGRNNMKTLFAVVVLLLVAIVGVGFYRGLVSAFDGYREPEAQRHNYGGQRQNPRG